MWLLGFLCIFWENSRGLTLSNWPKVTWQIVGPLSVARLTSRYKLTFAKEEIYCVSHSTRIWPLHALLKRLRFCILYFSIHHCLCQYLIRWTCNILNSYKSCERRSSPHYKVFHISVFHMLSYHIFQFYCIRCKLSDSLSQFLRGHCIFVQKPTKDSLIHSYLLDIKLFSCKIQSMKMQLGALN